MWWCWWFQLHNHSTSVSRKILDESRVAHRSPIHLHQFNLLTRVGRYSWNTTFWTKIYIIPMNTWRSFECDALAFLDSTSKPECEVSSNRGHACIISSEEPVHQCWNPTLDRDDSINNMFIGAQFTSQTVVLLNHIFRSRSKRTSKLRVTCLWPMNSPHKGPVMRKVFPFYDIIMMAEQGFSNWKKTYKYTDVTISLISQDLAQLQIENEPFAYRVICIKPIAIATCLRIASRNKYNKGVHNLA